MRQLLVIVSLATFTLYGCADMSATQQGTATGAGTGAGLGAILGAATSGGGSRTAGDTVLGAAAGAAIGNIWSTRMENQRRTMEQATQGTGVTVSQTSDNRLKLDIPSDISFDTNLADIKNNVRPVLDSLAASLTDHASTNITIVGHTDNSGSAAINNPLSLDRAVHTRDYLVSRGAQLARFTVSGRGDREPLAANTDEDGRARNRRVELYVAEQQ